MLLRDLAERPRDFTTGTPEEINTHKFVDSDARM
jgi:hypothetical protein